MTASLIRPEVGEITGLPNRPALMFQENRLLPWFSALKNVSAVCPEEKARCMLKKAFIYEDMHKLPAELSGGMCRRTALARALCFDADFLLLDEPFTGLDPGLREKMAELIIDRCLPAIVVTHSEQDAQLLGGSIVEL